MNLPMSINLNQGPEPLELDQRVTDLENRITLLAEILEALLPKVMDMHKKISLIELDCKYLKGF